MKLFLIVLLLLAVSSVAAQTKPVESGVEKEVRAVELARFDAQVKSDIDKLKPLLADELKYTHSSGRTETREEFLKALGSSLKYQSIEPSQVEVRVYGDTAIITGQAAIKVESGGQQLSMKIKYTDAYVKRDGRWQMIVWQSTRLPD